MLIVPAGIFRILLELTAKNVVNDVLVLHQIPLIRQEGQEMLLRFKELLKSWYCLEIFHVRKGDIITACIFHRVDHLDFLILPTERLGHMRQEVLHG